MSYAWIPLFFLLEQIIFLKRKCICVTRIRSLFETIPDTIRQVLRTSTRYVLLSVQQRVSLKQKGSVQRCALIRRGASRWHGLKSIHLELGVLVE